MRANAGFARNMIPSRCVRTMPSVDASHINRSCSSDRVTLLSRWPEQSAILVLDERDQMVRAASIAGFVFGPTPFVMRLRLFAVVAEICDRNRNVAALASRSTCSKITGILWLDRLYDESGRAQCSPTPHPASLYR
jgi:hypothetical protein